MVAAAKDEKNRPITSLTTKMLSASGGDQMSIEQTRTFFSEKVADVMESHGYVCVVCT